MESSKSYWKGADSGVDGYINFFDDNSGKAKRIIVQVKSGHVNRGMIATLKGDMERENAALGIFITLEPPTKPMEQEAIAAGFYEPESLSGDQYPKVQILTIEATPRRNPTRIPPLRHRRHLQTRSPPQAPTRHPTNPRHLETF